MMALRVAGRVLAMRASDAHNRADEHAVIDERMVEWRMTRSEIASWMEDRGPAIRESGTAAQAN